MIIMLAREVFIASQVYSVLIFITVTVYLLFPPSESMIFVAWGSVSLCILGVLFYFAKSVLDVHSLTK